MGVSYLQMLAFDEEQESDFFVKHGKTFSKMIALTICRGFISGWLLTPFVALSLRWFVSDRVIYILYHKYVRLLDARSFRNIIRSVESQNLMKPVLSQKRNGS
jgi:hypothetical protein